MSRREGWWPQTPCAAIAGLDLPASCFKVLLALHQFANHDGIAWPSQEKLGAVTALHRRSVNKALDQLVDEGIVERTDEYRHRARVYRLHLNDLSRFGHTSAAGDVSRNGHMSSDDVCPNGPTTCRDLGTHTYQEQSQDPGTEPYDVRDAHLVELELDGARGRSTNGHDRDAGDRAACRAFIGWGTRDPFERALIGRAFGLRELDEHEFAALGYLAVEEPERLVRWAKHVTLNPDGADAFREWLREARA